MHPIKVSLHDTLLYLHTEPKGVRPVDHYQQTDFGLYVARRFQHHPRIQYWEAHLIPRLGLQVNVFHYHDEARGDHTHDYYLDVMRIQHKGHQWCTEDYYLDLLVYQGSHARILDTDEYLHAVQDGTLSAESAGYALMTAHRALNNLGLFGHDLDAWLASEGIELFWQEEPVLSRSS
ncbi:DUF402 domain-containing protein [Deinococcus roseus]|uniref:DUF402 domain-containing protein n=1 Tax=Deinococcus roseus TaxID=392414 RepID=A0ABQ2DHG6_9DEIO|nr:DUF402 domain-containing protein [Deinococcus roseus]GGJ57879.1 hypothetical protein GCM10008938_49990 [Deinococcus roseus]